MAIEAELADGRILEFPDGTDPKVIQSAVKRLMGQGETTFGGQAKELAKGVVPGAIGLLETAGVGASALLPDEYEKTTREFIKGAAAAGKKPFEAAPGYEESVGRKLGEGIGSTVPFFALGPAGLAGRIGAGALGVGAGAGEARQAAEAKGATAEERRTATQFGAPVGLLDMLAPTIGPMKNIIATALARGGMEGATEAAQKISQNLIAKGVYDPTQDVLAGSGEEGAYGAGVGALTSLLVDMALGRRARGAKTTEPLATPAQAPEQEPLALGMNAPFVPVGLPDGSVANTPAELDAYRQQQEFGANLLAQPADVKPAPPTLALGMAEPFVPVVLPDGSVAATPADLEHYRQQQQFGANLLAQPATRAEKIEGLDEAEIEARFSRYNQGLKAAKDKLVAGQITPEQFTGLQEQYNRFRQEYDAYKERTAQPLRPDQKEAADIADKIELLGEKGFADAVRGAVKSGRPINQDNIQFYNEKLAEFQARKAEEGQRIEEEHGFSKYLEGDKDQARFKAALNSKNKDVSDTLKSADEHIQKITDTINRLGYKVDSVGSSSPTALRDLKSQMSALAGITHRLTMDEEAVTKGYKRGDPEKLVRSIAETNAEIAKTQALIEKASVEKNELTEPPEIAQANKDIAAAEMGMRKVKRESPSLWTALTGKLAAGEVRDIFSSKPTFGQRSLQTERGAQVSDLVSDGALDDFLPPDMRHDSQTFDETASTERIKEKLREQNYVTFDAEIEIKTLFKSVEEAESLIREYLTVEEANKLILEAQNEQDEAGRTAEEIVTQGATGAPEAVSTQDLAAQATELGIDVDALAEDVARRSADMTQEQYNAELRNALESAIKSEQGQQMVEMQSAETGFKGYNATKEGQQMEKDLTGKSIFQAAKYLVDKAPNAFYKYVANKIVDKLNKMQAEGVRLNFMVNGGNEKLSHMYRSNGKCQMLYSKDGQPLTFNVVLNGEPTVKNQATHPSGMDYKTLMHELLHVATQGELAFLSKVNNNHPAVVELYKLGDIVSKEFLKQHAEGTLPDFLLEHIKGRNNALASVDEMLTWSMTDERMQKWMDNIKVGEKTLFDKIVELIRSIMGVPKPYETALDRLVRTTDQIIDIEISRTADGAKRLGYSYGPAGGPKRIPREQQTLFSRAAQKMMESELRLGKEEQTTTPTGAGADSMRVLESLGRANQETEPGYREKVRQAWDNARDNPKATAEAATAATKSWLDKLETWAFSSDAALNNRIRREIEQSTLADKEKIGLLLNTSLSQTVHSDAVASLFLQKGAIKYNNELHKWEGVDSKANFVELSKQLDELAAKNGLTKQQAELVAHTAFEAKRLRSMVRFNQELEQKIAEVKAEAASKRGSSPVAASALSEKAARMQDQFKYISDSQLAMIEPGMSLFKIHPELNKVVETWNNIRTNTVKTLVETGLWSETEAEEMLANADYVPFYREDQLEQNKGPKEFIRGLQVQAKEKRLKGSDRPVNDIFDNQVRWVQYSINRAVRNRSALALADTAVAVGAATPVTSEQRKGAENVVRVWRDGKEEFVSMQDPMFIDAFTGLEAIVIPSWKWASSLANMLRQSVVMYPMFSVAQVPQDSFAAMFSSGLKPQYALRIPVLAVKEFVQTLRGKSKTHEELKNVGAVGVRDFTSAMVRLDAEIFAGLKAPPGVLGKVKYALNHIAMSADNAVRQAVYEASMSQGLSRAEAMEKAFDVFNVRRKGSSKSLALAGQLIPFFSAYLAAQNVAYKTITGRGISPTERQDAFKTLAATTASVMVLSLLYAMMNGDDEDYLKKPATVRDRLLMVPGTGGFSLPLRADLFTMPKIITEHMYLMMTDKGYEDGRKFRDSMAAALGSALLSPTAVPQAIKPLVEVGINYDFFQGRPLVGTYQQKLETERQFTDSTSELGKILGKTGLVSPIAADHLLRGMFGSAGGLIIYATNPILHSDPNTPRPSLSEKDAIAALPGMSGFMMKSYESALKKDFYTLKEEVDKAANTLNDLKKRSPQQIEGFLKDEENLARVGLQKSVNAIGERLSNIRAAITQITNSSMPADQKQQQIEMLRKAEEDMLKGVNVKMLRELGKI